MSKSAKNLNLFQKIKKSFITSWKGEESLKNIFIWWGGLSFAICYFVISPLINFSKIEFINISLSSMAIIYYIWHIIVIRKCSPKKPKLSKEEKKKLKEEKRKEMPKSFARKLFLQEPISKWNSSNMIIAIDLYIILVYSTNFISLF